MTKSCKTKKEKEKIMGGIKIPNFYASPLNQNYNEVNVQDLQSMGKVKKIKKENTLLMKIQQLRKILYIYLKALNHIQVRKLKLVK